MDGDVPGSAWQRPHGHPQWDTATATTTYQSLGLPAQSAGDSGITSSTLPSPCHWHCPRLLHTCEKGSSWCMGARRCLPCLWV